MTGAQQRVVELVRRASALLESGSAEAAIEALDEALNLLDPGQRSARGTVLFNLGIAYRGRTFGDPADNRERTVELLEQAVALRDREREPLEWARVQNALGVALYERLRGDPLENGRRAIETLITALDTRRRFGDPDEQAITLTNLANVESGMFGPDRDEDIERAVRHYREALELLHPENHETRAAVLRNLASVLLDRSAGDRARNVEDAVSALEQALEAGLEPSDRRCSWRSRTRWDCGYAATRPRPSSGPLPWPARRSSIAAGSSPANARRPR